MAREAKSVAVHLRASFAQAGQLWGGLRMGPGCNMRNRLTVLTALLLAVPMMSAAPAMAQMGGMGGMGGMAAEAWVVWAAVAAWVAVMAAATWAARPMADLRAAARHGT